MPLPSCRHHYSERSSTSSRSIGKCGVLVRLKVTPGDYREAVERMARVLDEVPTFDEQCRFDGGPRCPRHEP